MRNETNHMSAITAIPQTVSQSQGVKLGIRPRSGDP